MNQNVEPNTDEKDKKESTQQKSTSKREFILNDTVNNVSVKDIVLGILEINRTDAEKEKEDAKYVRKPINLIVNTYGGSVYDGFGLVAVIDSSETPVHTYLYGKAMSMGLLIYASGHRRFAHPLGTLMYHQISTGAQGKIGDIQLVLDQSNKLNERYDGYLLSVTNLPKDKIDLAKDRKEELYMTPLEAIEFGLVDEIIPTRRKTA